MFCNHAPFNILCISSLSQIFPNALVIVMIRNEKWVIQGLEHSFIAGYKWAGETLEERAEVWANYYLHLSGVDLPNVVTLDYDELCLHPRKVLERLTKTACSFLGCRPEDFDKSVFAKSWANDRTSGRSTLSRIEEKDAITFNPLKGFDETQWKDGWSERIQDILRPTIEVLDLFKRRHLAV
ncbi:sulfotransferase [Rhodovulum sulfidophilum]|uniref:sulfotransferase n=1 Tax=Rhodovulum sulfidophilum TaxID=35806 RepID=UPI00095110A1|nr:sulfotransferase [Rhodovulum sulfidophilum]MBL3553520.1 sulfotransferase [Rhodovulum sulfidophilum]OLS49520.1 hypothetical protein BV379_15350 [Rhodovulum sulfidophilum]